LCIIVKLPLFMHIEQDYTLKMFIAYTLKKAINFLRHFGSNLHRNLADQDRIVGDAPNVCDGWAEY